MANVDISELAEMNSKIRMLEEKLRAGIVTVDERGHVQDREDLIALGLGDLAQEKKLFLRERGLDSGGYLRENFRDTDRIAVVMIKGSHVIQRIDEVGEFARDKYQEWLHQQNKNGYGIYHSMNTIKPYRFTRRENDIAAVRHVWLDLDRGGRPAVEKLLTHADIPPPHHVLNTSPDKYQLIWKAEKFSRKELGPLLKNLARESGADPNATDPGSRVMRMPGFANQKYPKLEHYVTMERVAAAGEAKVTPRQFPDRLYREKTRERVQEPARERQPVSLDARVSQEVLLKWALENAARVGSRNRGGYDFAFQLHSNGYTQHEAERAMRQYKALVPEVDSSGKRDRYTDREMKASLWSAFQRPPGEPWQQRQPAQRERA